MNKLSDITNLIKKIYRDYSNNLINQLASMGFNDLRASFLEILIYLCEKDHITIKEIGIHCGLKKQTMTSHLNELEKRGYIQRGVNPDDRRELNVSLTEYGQKFKMTLMQTNSQLEKNYLEVVGENEFERVNNSLHHFYDRVSKIKKP